MEIYEIEDGIRIEGIKHFSAQHIFECGQCFRWERETDGSYTGVAHGRVINVKDNREVLWIRNTDLSDFQSIWWNYFDFNQDYGAIKAHLSNDEIMKKAMSFGWGIRLLNQEVWECLVSFIISANNSIPRIAGIIKNLCRVYGKPINFNGKVYYSFPTPEELYGQTEEDLAFCRSGYRCKYIIDAVRAVAEGRLKITELYNLSTEEAKQQLMKIKGVGPKVADCILLFSLKRRDVFPTDVWVRRIVEQCYFKNEMTIRDVQNFAHDQYGDLRGFAQQYLFYYGREFKIGKY